MQGPDIVFHDIVLSLKENPVLSGVTVLVIFAFISDLFLFRRLRRLVRGGDGKTLEGTIIKLQERVAILESHAVKAEAAFENVDERLQGSIRGVAVHRFDPFQGGGGQQSFAAALLDEHGDGAVISGIHARDGSRVYAKSVKGFLSERELSEDERQAIADAKKNLKQP